MREKEIRVVLLVLLLAGVGILPMVSAEDGEKSSHELRQVDMETDTEGYEPVDLHVIHPFIENATPYYYVLTLSDQGKQNHIRDLETVAINGAPISADEKSRISSGLTAIWDKYPIISETSPGSAGFPTYGGNIITLRFSPSVEGTKLSDEENEFLENFVALESNSYAEQHAHDVTPRWGLVRSHQRISYWAAVKESFPNPNTVKDASDDPDYWYGNPPDPIGILFHSYDHYWSPAGTGGAPEEAENYAQIAKDYYDDGSYSDAAMNIGYALHFLADVGNPMHTGYEPQQIANQWTHSNYEKYIDDNWGACFESVMANNDQHLTYSDWNEGTKDLARYSNQYVAELYNRIFDKGQNWDCSDDNDINRISRNVLRRTARFANGMVFYAKGG